MPKETVTITIEKLTDEEVAAEQQSEPVTLEDMPEGVACAIVDSLGTMSVRLRRGEAVCWVDGDGRAIGRTAIEPCRYRVIARLDGLPLPVKTKPLPKTLGGCPAVTERAVVYETSIGRRFARIGDEVWQIDPDAGAWLWNKDIDAFSIASPTNLRLTVKQEGGES